ncbi:MAG: Smr/MutS family protein [Holosporales bacterium]
MTASHDDDAWGAYKKAVKPLTPKALRVRLTPSKPKNPRPPIKADEMVVMPPDPRPLDVQHISRKERRRLDPEAILDLHGMTQEQAWQALDRFLKRCALQGYRCVLVITGKARDTSTEAHPDPGHHGRGVLRRQVPQWLAQPEMRAVVASYVTASLRHGGTGAYYIFLKQTFLG